MNNIYITKILVRGDKVTSNDYVIGRIMGVNYVMCNGVPDNGWGVVVNDDGTRVFNTECSAGKYAAFADVVDEMYPGLGIFDYKE